MKEVLLDVPRMKVQQKKVQQTSKKAGVTARVEEDSRLLPAIAMAPGSQIGHLHQ